MTTEQIQIWKSDFGKEYTTRNTCKSLEDFNQVYIDRFGKTKSELTQPFLENILDETSKILEVGANVGYQLRNLQRAGFQYLYGVEIQRDAIEKGRELHHGIDIIEGSALDIPYKDGFFDLVFTETVLIHFSPDDIDRALDEIYRCSRKYIWGLEYFAEQHTEVRYHGRARFVWKGDFARKFIQRFSNLELLREERLPYLNEKRKIAAMFLLEKK